MPLYKTSYFETKRGNSGDKIVLLKTFPDEAGYLLTNFSLLGATFASAAIFDGIYIYAGKNESFDMLNR
jgi:hypothetical protein